MKKNTVRISVGKLERNNDFENMDIGGRIILKWILSKSE
jgi:hypothetical protein